jgi:hypothetical protein
MNHEDTKGAKKSGNKNWISNTILPFLAFAVLGALGVLVVQMAFIFNFFGCFRSERFI